MVAVAEVAVGMRRTIGSLSRYIAATAQGKRIFFCWYEPMVSPSNLTNVFAFDDDFAMGVLTSRIHAEWARAQSSTLEDRMRYTPTSAFETFPWPTSPAAKREEIGAIAHALIERRQAICIEREIGLTELYNEVDDGAYADLRRLHAQLDLAVAAAYGWPASAATDARRSPTGCCSTSIGGSPPARPTTRSERHPWPTVDDLWRLWPPQLSTRPLGAPPAVTSPG